MREEIDTLQILRKLAGTIPCEMCRAKGKENYESDGGCRHRPMIDSPITDQEVITRLTFAVHVLKNPFTDFAVEPEHNHFGDIFMPSACPACKFLANQKSGQ